MLIMNPFDKNFASKLRKQAGVVLFIALIVLVAMTLGAVALIRSVDTTNLIAGNLAFQQSAIHSADAGFEAAISWLQANKATGLLTGQGDNTNGYYGNGAAATNNLGHDANTATWDALWTNVFAQNAVQGTPAVDQAGNSYRYVIHRMCMTNGPSASSGCGRSPAVTVSAANQEDQGGGQFVKPPSVYYRITVRVDGPKNTVAYVQTIVSM